MRGETRWRCVHRFNDSLTISRAYSEAPWWGTVYRQAFRGFAGMYDVRQDGWAQRAGIDRVIVLRSGKTLWVDEKVRTEDYNDFLLERWSDRERRRPGWIQKELACDYIAYAFVPSARCFLLPFLPLQRAWRLHGPDWIRRAGRAERGYRLVQAENPGYVTESIAVPIPVVLAALQQGLEVRWDTAGHSTA